MNIGERDAVRLVYVTFYLILRRQISAVRLQNRFFIMNCFSLFGILIVNLLLLSHHRRILFIFIINCFFFVFDAFSSF